MIEKIIEYSGFIFAAVGILCLFLESLSIFKRYSISKLTIAGLVFLAISVIGFIVTHIILRDIEVSFIFTVLWIALLWAYLICNIVSAFLVSRRNRAEKRHQQQSDEYETDDNDEQDDE